MRVLTLLFSLMALTSQAQTSSSPASTTTLEAYWSMPVSDTSVGKTLLVNSIAGIPEPGSTANVVLLEQSGQANQATLQLIDGPMNRLQVSQQDNQNSLTATLVGSNNSLLIQQQGNDNRIEIGLSGANNRMLLSQDGGDILLMNGLQQNNSWLEVSQKAGQNSLTLDNSLFLSAPFTTGARLRIEQSGGATAVIHQGTITTLNR